MINKKSLTKQLNYIYDAAEEAGIIDAVFLGYGTLLGVVRDGGFIPHDDDADVCVLADRTTGEAEERFIASLRSRGLYKHRERIVRRNDTGRVLWSSLKMDKDGTKTCIWFQQRWRNAYWHSKAKDWVRKIGLRLKPTVDQSYDAIMKGTPGHLFDEMKRINFGRKWQIPKKYGSLLDFWYPNWAIPRVGGASRTSYYAIIPCWKNECSWKMLVK